MRFKVGERVRVRQESAGGNPRTPAYVRGKVGTVVALHGQVENPLDHRGVYPPLYTLEFEVRDLFGGSGRDRVTADIHEEWLEPA